ncbi:hypothetical protein GGF43_005047 [Coemansia sp. RSA 2618]|nr:hypothetical protein GGF43_005047 [Coemansia sp. RSA 2618]
MTSLICAALTIISATIVLFRHREKLGLPSLRISIAIAVCDIIYSTCQIFFFNNSYMSERTELQLRAFLWMMAGSTVTFVLLTVCVGLHMVLLVLTKGNGWWASRLLPWYEIVSFTLGFLITHPYMYLFESVQWIPTAQVFYIKDTMSASRRNVWLLEWMWVFSGIVFLFVVAVLMNIYMSSAWRNLEKVSNVPGDIEAGSGRSTFSEMKRKKIRSVTFRLTLYPMIPVVTQIMVVVGNLLLRSPFWVYVLASIMPSFQGTFNFFAYVLNPTLDGHRHKIVDFVLRRNQGKKASKFAALKDTESTHHLSETLRAPDSLYSLSKEEGVYQI